jgi:hypothetical protein
MNGEPGSTQILTRHSGAQFQTINQLKGSGTTPTSKSPLLSPSRLSKHLRMGFVGTLHNILTTQKELWGFIKPSAQNQEVHMGLSLRLRMGVGEYAPMI